MGTGPWAFCKLCWGPHWSRPGPQLSLVLQWSGPSLMARSWRSIEQKQFHMTAELSVTLMEQGPNKRALGPCLNQPECEHCPSPR